MIIKKKIQNRTKYYTFQNYLSKMKKRIINTYYIDEMHVFFLHFGLFYIIE